MLYFILMEMGEKQEKSGKKKTSGSKKKNKTWLLIVAVVLGILIGLGIFFQKKILELIKPGQKTTVPLGEQKEKEDFKFDWALWEDASGFAFEYPRDLKVDTHPDDETNYSFLAITSSERQGKIDIYCNDTKYKTVEEWLTKESLVKQGSFLDTKVASVSGKRVAIGNGRELTAFIDWDEVIYVIDKQSEEEVEFWQQVYSRIVSSFKLIPLENESEADFSEWLGGFETSGMDVVEAVEVIE